MAVKGSGPDLVVIHGASGNAAGSDLAADRPSAPATGSSCLTAPVWAIPTRSARATSLQAQALHQARRRKCWALHDPVVLGQSYGGAVALAWALGRLKPRALVLVGSPSLPWPGRLDIWYRLTNTWPAAPLPSRWPRPSCRKAMSMPRRRFFAPDPVPPAMTTYLGTPLTLRRQSLATNTPR